ncbi:MAG TPA: primase C-terminal domain-containing protein [Candidatus Binatia bacterium]|nr:primase C-terminal domain-containing protein [Candidatus Binatia bacterium]
MRKFNLVDFAAHYQKGFRNHIVSITEVPALVESFKNYGCYATYFFYSDEILTYLSAQAEVSAPTIAGYKGKVWAPYFPIDLDHPELTPALDAARYLTALLMERWRIDPTALQIYFSGSKGFHLLLDSHLFGKIAPSKSLPLMFDSLRRHLAHELPEELRETVDLAIKDRVRLLRLPNTQHEKSKLYKVLLSPDELDSLGPEEIRERARAVRPLTMTDETGFLPRVDVTENPHAAQLFGRIRRQLKKMTRKPFRYRFHRPSDLRRIEFPCAGIQKIWESHVELGYRNNCAIRLASELRLLGLNEDEANEKIFEWNESNRIDLPSDELHSVVRSAYQHRFPYRYSCRDEILRRFCPLPDYDSCRDFVAAHAQPQGSAERP